MLFHSVTMSHPSIVSSWQCISLAPFPVTIPCFQKKNGVFFCFVPKLLYLCMKFTSTMLKFISFGSGSSGNCYLLYTERDALLIDAGVGVRMLKKYFSNYGLSLRIVHNILITHDHADHVKSVGSLSGEYGLPVYATEEVHRGIERNYCVRRKVDQASKHFVEKGKTFIMGDFEVTPFAVPHDSADNVGYRIVCGSVVFCLITDVGHITDEIKSFIHLANYLVLEANYDAEMLMDGAYPQYLKERINCPTGHLSNRDCAVALAENATTALKQVWLCHLSEENNHPELARKTVESILHSYGIVPGKDFGLEVLKRRTPSEIYTLR